MKNSMVREGTRAPAVRRTDDVGFVLILSLFVVFAPIVLLTVLASAHALPTPDSPGVHAAEPGSVGRGAADGETAG